MKEHYRSIDLFLRAGQLEEALNACALGNFYERGFELLRTNNKGTDDPLYARMANAAAKVRFAFALLLLVAAHPRRRQYYASSDREQLMKFLKASSFPLERQLQILKREHCIPEYVDVRPYSRW